MKLVANAEKPAAGLIQVSLPDQTGNTLLGISLVMIAAIMPCLIWLAMPHVQPLVLEHWVCRNLERGSEQWMSCTRQKVPAMADSPVLVGVNETVEVKASDWH